MCNQDHFLTDAALHTFSPLEIELFREECCFILDAFQFFLKLLLIMGLASFTLKDSTLCAQLIASFILCCLSIVILVVDLEGIVIGKRTTKLFQ